MTTAWKYGAAGDTYDVATGDIWRVGPHTLACGDLELGHARQVLALTGQPDMTYCDPPWTPALASGFRTKAGYQKRSVDFLALLKRIVQAVSGTKGDIYLEMGNKYADVLTEFVETVGGRLLDDWNTEYGQHHASRLLRYKFTPGGEDVPDFTGMNDLKTPELAIESSSLHGGLVWDPCTGRGLTATTAASVGRRFVGLELHPRRLAVTIDLLVKATGLPAERSSDRRLT